jgi:hypothetical protein
MQPHTEFVYEYDRRAPDDMRPVNPWLIDGRGSLTGATAVLDKAPRYLASDEAELHGAAITLGEYDEWT